MKSKVAQICFEILNQEPSNHIASVEEIYTMNFLTDCYMESVVFVDLVTALEEEFGFVTPYDQMMMESFSSVDEICKLISEVKG